MKKYNYGILLLNNPDLKKESVYLDNKYKENKKYALIERQVFADGSEGINRIIYSNDLQKMVESLKIYPTYYNYLSGYGQNLSGKSYKLFIKQ